MNVIEIKAGFLKLQAIGRLITPPDRGSFPRAIWVKGSAITSVEQDTVSANPQGESRSFVGGSVAILQVAHRHDEIIDAIAESYKQAARR
jgi:hypothetical protein